jgi:hypothetical protein
MVRVACSVRRTSVCRMRLCNGRQPRYRCPGRKDLRGKQKRPPVRWACHISPARRRLSMELPSCACETTSRRGGSPGTTDRVVHERRSPPVCSQPTLTALSRQSPAKRSYHSAAACQPRLASGHSLPSVAYVNDASRPRCAPPPRPAPGRGTAWAGTRPRPSRRSGPATLCRCTPIRSTPAAHTWQDPL